MASASDGPETEQETSNQHQQVYERESHNKVSTLLDRRGPTDWQIWLILHPSHFRLGARNNDLTVRILFSVVSLHPP